MDDGVLVEFEDCCAPSNMMVDVSELGLDDGAKVPSKTVLELNELGFAFTTVPFETELSIPSFRAVSFVEFQSNQRQAEYSSHTTSLPT